MKSENTILLMSGLVVEDVVAKIHSILLSNFSLSSSSLTMPVFLSLVDVEHKVVVELLKVHSLVVRSCCSTVVVQFFVASFLLNNSLLSMLL